MKFAFHWDWGRWGGEVGVAHVVLLLKRRLFSSICLKLTISVGHLHVWVVGTLLTWNSHTDTGQLSFLKGFLPIP